MQYRLDNQIEKCSECGGMFDREFLSKVVQEVEDRMYKDGYRVNFIYYCIDHKKPYTRVDFKNSYWKEIQVDKYGKPLNKK